MEHESILAHLAPLLTNQIENVATDALAHLLLQYPFIADSFREYISSMMVDLPGNLSFTTQARWQDNAIPDLVGQDEQGRYLLIIESKFWALLTPNQPATYIGRLPPDKPALLLFITPASRIPSLWKELLSRCTPLSHKEELKEEEKGEIRNLLLNSKHTLSLISWENLLGVLDRKAKVVNDQYAISDIWQLQSLCEIIEENAFTPVTKDEILSPTQKRIHQFKGIVDDLVILLCEAGLASTIGYRATPGPNYYKRYMSLTGLPNSNWCVEMNIQYKKKYSSTYLCLTASAIPQTVDLFTGANLLYHRYNKCFIVPLEIPTDVEKEIVLTSLMEQVTKVSKLLISK